MTKRIPVSPPDDLERGTLRGRPRRMVRMVVLGLFRVIFRMRLEHVERVPAEGPVPVVRQIMRRGGAFPVDRGKADRAAIKRAHATLAQGIALGMFPEGTRSVTR